MPAAGWFPDPDGKPGRYRYWNGSAWTDLTSTSPGGNPGAGENSAPGSGPHRGLILGVLGLLVVVVVMIAAVVIRSHRPEVIVDDYPAQSTASSWNDSSPLPTENPQPSEKPQPTGQPQPSGQPRACEQYDNSPPAAEPDDGRVHGGPLSFQKLGNAWSQPYALNRFPFSKDAYVQIQVLHQKLAWQASVEVGESTMRPFPGANRATAELLQCLLTSDFYSSMHVKVTEDSSKSIMISGTQAVQRDALLRFHNPELTTTGSRIRIIVVDSDPITYYFSAVPMERSDLVSQLDRTTASLRVDK